MDWAGIAQTLGAAAFLAAASAWDVKERRIPNWLSGAAAAAGLLIGAASGSLGFSASGLAWGFAAGFLLWAAGVVGEGDAKAAAALGALGGRDAALASLVLGLLCLAAWTLAFRLARWGWRRVVEEEKRGLLFLAAKARLARPPERGFDPARAPFLPFFLAGWALAAALGLA